ncbi:porin [Mitsuaria sp. GD03876]|uniref:porin n=1 Tax=Mitsuaria sp. GD03876 TaxID=2975399 RepID=UPI002449B51F|nr:porin [Mitsuaria sp. GD03876]MDH0868325.1 porin [Mitsuaria sp. GD03876]
MNLFHTPTRSTRLNGLCAAGLLALCAAPSAFAQSSVTVYGIADVLLEYRDKMNAAGDHRFGVTSGGMNTSRWGLRGAEDLGGGLKAVFQLEAEVGFDSGAAGSSFWGRQANVGLEGEFGRVIAGRSYSTTYDFMLPFDPMGYAPFYSWATSGGQIANQPRKDGMVTGVSNLIKYQGTFGPVKVGATYALGEVTGSDSAGRFFALAGAYSDGPFAATLVVDQRNGATLAGNGRYDKEKALHWGLSYDWKPVKLFLAQRAYKKEFAAGGANAKSTMTWVGATWQATPALSITPAFYFQDISSGASGTDDPKLFALRAKYELSKRTSLYAVASTAKSGDGGQVSVSRDDNGFGDSQNSLGVGIQHRF